MNDNIEKIITIAQIDFASAMELAPYVPGAMEAILMHTHPSSKPQHRRFFSDAAKNPETDPEILHSIGTRDLPTRIRLAVIENPSTLRKTIEKMARQTANDVVTRRARKFLEANTEPPKGNVIESKFKLSSKQIKQIINEELRNVLNET